MDELKRIINLMESRRGFLKTASLGFGSLALGSLLNASSFGNDNKKVVGNPESGVLGACHFPPRAKRVIYLFQSGGPSQLESFDHKPELAK